MTGTNKSCFFLICLFIMVTNAAQIPEENSENTSPSSLNDLLLQEESHGNFEDNEHQVQPLIPKLDATVLVKCRQSDMLITIDAPHPGFAGMVYPRGLGKNSSCLVQYHHPENLGNGETAGPVEYTLPLRSCNTMPKLLEDGALEYFNTIVVQPHLKLVTGLGKAYHVRCKYRSKERQQPILEKSSSNLGEEKSNKETEADNMRARQAHQGRSLGHHQVNVVTHSPELPMPACTMQIFSGDPAKKEVAQNVKIGDMLTLVVEMDSQDLYGFRITDCSVRDGLGWSEQKLIDPEGCSTDDDIMGTFMYNADQSRAEAKFAAHKFPYTASVYYQCNARLCLKEIDGCRVPSCDDLQRVRRASADEENERKEENHITASRQQQSQDDGEDGAPATIQVFSGLYVNEGADLAGSLEDDVLKEKTLDDALCVPQRAFAVGVAVAGLLLMLAVLAAILVLLARRRTRGKASATSSSSVYSGPYTNTAYSHSS